MEPNKKKIVDLGILESDEVSGVKKISLVEEPAIMLDFQYFNTQKFKKITCDSCDWTWDLAEGGEDPYTCHKCGNINTHVIEEFESYSD
jgi:predicted nucleic-acid-binding Zn-ribbon protein